MNPKFSASFTPSVPTRAWHQFPAHYSAEWREALQKGGVNVWLNFGGEAEVAWEGGPAARLRGGGMIWLRAPTENLTALRRISGRQRHECLTLFFPDAWISASLRDTTTALPDDLRRVVLPPFSNKPQSASRPLTPELRTWAHGFMAAHLCAAARQLLDTARLTEFFLSQLFHQPPEADAFCTRTKRIARERVEKVKSALIESLDEPPPLDALAALAGCNPHYLSRTFSQEEGLTISLWLRRQRIERAAALIASGQCNVSEAAIEVGYRSFSHFSRAFQQEKGVAPSRWARTRK